MEGFEEQFSIRHSVETHEYARNTAPGVPRGSPGGQLGEGLRGQLPIRAYSLTDWTDVMPVTVTGGDSSSVP